MKPIQTTSLDGCIYYGPRPGTRVRGEYLGTPFSGVILQSYTDNPGHYVELDEPIACGFPGEFRSQILIRVERPVRSEHCYTDIIRLEARHNGSGEYRTYIEAG